MPCKITTTKWPAPNVSGFIARLECRTAIARSRVQTPLKSWLFQASIRNCLNCVHNCDDHGLLEQKKSWTMWILLNREAEKHDDFWKILYSPTVLAQLFTVGQSWTSLQKLLLWSFPFELCFSLKKLVTHGKTLLAPSVKWKTYEEKLLFFQTMKAKERFCFCEEWISVKCHIQAIICHYCCWKWCCWNVFNFKNSNLCRGSQFERYSAFFTIFSSELCPLEISQDSQDEVHKLRDCISVLFMFVRQPIKDEEFVLILNEWMEQLVCESFILKCHASSCPNPPIRSVALKRD